MCLVSVTYFATSLNKHYVPSLRPPYTTADLFVNVDVCLQRTMQMAPSRRCKCVSIILWQSFTALSLSDFHCKWQTYLVGCAQLCSHVHITPKEPIIGFGSSLFISPQILFQFHLIASPCIIANKMEAGSSSKGDINTETTGRQAVSHQSMRLNFGPFSYIHAGAILALFMYALVSLKG